MASFLGFNITRNTAAPKLIEGSDSTQGYHSFSTPFGSVGKGDLAKPFVSGAYLGEGGYVRFGTDNLYPQIINQMYYTSPLNSAIINLKVNAAVGGGFEISEGSIDGKGKVDEYTFLRKNKVKKLLKTITRNYVMHGAVYICIHSNENGPTHFELIPSEKVRNNKLRNMFFISDDWSRGMYSEAIKLYSPLCKDKKQILVLELDAPGQDYYPIPSYTTAFNWCFLDGQMSYLHKSNIQNSIFPSFALMLPKIPASKAEEESIASTLEKAKGAGEAGKAIVFAANGKDNLPELVPIPTNDNDKLFLQTDERIDLKISQAHEIDPLLAGIRTSGKLGSGTDIKQAYTIFEKNVIKPIREDIESFMDELMLIFRITGDFAIKDFQIINEIIVENIDDNASATNDALNAMSPLVSTKVLDNLTPDEIRALASLKPKTI